MKLTCKEAARLMSQEMDAPLPFLQRTALRLHLLICDACSNARRQFDLLRRAVRRLGAP